MNMKIDRIRDRIEAVIFGKHNDSILAKALGGVSKVYGLAMALRLSFYKTNLLKTFRLPCTVISIGNITLGGTGKTPMVLYIAELLKNSGLNTAIVCRGYKGKYEHSIKMVTDGSSIFMGPEEAGDEPHLMATRLSDVPIFVGKNRYASAMKAWQYFRPDVILLDDAFQHIRLFRDLDLLLLDSSSPIGNGHIFPRGILREPLKHICRADAFVATRSEAGRFLNSFFIKNKMISGKPLFRCYHLPDSVSVLDSDGRWVKSHPENIRGEKKCVAFAGIAKNEDFMRMLTDFGCRVTDFINFPDHHDFSAQDVKNILRSAEKNRAEFLITTEKDRVKIMKNMFSPMKIYSLGIKISFAGLDKDRFREFILKRVTST